MIWVEEREGRLRDHGMLVPWYTMITDTEIVRGFEECTLSPAAFRHREHLLVAWTYLRALPFAEAAARFATNVRLFADAHGAAG